MASILSNAELKTGNADAAKKNVEELFSYLNAESPDSGFDTFVPQAAKYSAANYSTFERQAGNGEYDYDSRQGEIGDCGLLSTLRALRNSEGGRRALSEVMQYDAEGGKWSFNFKTADFDGTNPIIITQADVDRAIEEKRVSKGDDDVTATELAIEKYFQNIGTDTTNNTKDKIMKQIADLQNKARTSRKNAGMADRGYLDGVSPYVSYLFTGKVPQLLKTSDEASKQKAADFLENFDETTDLLVFSQINSSGVAASGGDSAYIMIGDDQIIQNHAYTVCDVDGDNVTLRESNNPSATIVVTKEELLNCTGKNSFYATELNPFK